MAGAQKGPLSRADEDRLVAEWDANRGAIPPQAGRIDAQTFALRWYVIQLADGMFFQDWRFCRRRRFTDSPWHAERFGSYSLARKISGLYGLHGRAMQLDTTITMVEAPE